MSAENIDLGGAVRVKCYDYTLKKLSVFLLDFTT